MLVEAVCVPLALAAALLAPVEDDKVRGLEPAEVALQSVETGFPLVQQGVPVQPPAHLLLEVLPVDDGEGGGERALEPQLQHHLDKVVLQGVALRNGRVGG